MSGDQRGQTSGTPIAQPPSFIPSYRSGHSLPYQSNDSDSDRESMAESMAESEAQSTQRKPTPTAAKPAPFRPTLLTSTQSSAARLNAASANATPILPHANAIQTQATGANIGTSGNAISNTSTSGTTSTTTATTTTSTSTSITNATAPQTPNKGRVNPKSPTFGGDAIRSDEDDADLDAGEDEANKQRIKVAHGLLNWRERVGLRPASTSSSNATLTGPSGDVHTPLLGNATNTPRYDTTNANPNSGINSEFSIPVSDDSGASQPPSQPHATNAIPSQTYVHPPGHRLSGNLPHLISEPHEHPNESTGLGFLSDDDPRRIDSDNLFKDGRIHTQRMMSQLTWLAVAISQGLLFPFFTMGESSPNGSTNSDWYRNLDRPPYTPPIEGHYVILTLLCFTQSRAAWLIWRRGGLSRQAPPLFLFFASFSLYQCWTVTFFAYHSAATALFVAFLMVASAFFAYVMFRARLKRAGQLVIPWLAWVIFLTVLTFDILVRN